MSRDKYNQRVAWLCTQVRMRNRFPEATLRKIARAARYVLGPEPAEEMWPRNNAKGAEWMATWEKKYAHRWARNSRRQLVPR
jgi:hypothetical protein